MQPNRLLVHYAEIALKGRNRPAFQRRLVNNVVRRMRAEGLDWRVAREHHRILVDIPETGASRLPEALRALADVAGIAWYAATRWLPSREEAGVVVFPEPREIAPAVLELARERFATDAQFAVRVRRADKRFPYSSQELERQLGARVLEETEWSRVNLTRPDKTFHAEITPEGVYVYAEKHPGLGGLPVGAAGRVLALLSGGLDSPVAAYLAAKRGCEVDFIHFTASRMQQSSAERYKVSELARQLSRVTLRSRLHLVPYLHFDAALMGTETAYGLVLFRRFMARAAERLAGELDARAIVTGDNLGQVASQTLDNIATTTRAVSMPILRPLITFDKREIIDRARRIGTYDLSIQPYKDCCALVDRSPRTTSRHEVMERMEAEIFRDYDGLIRESLEDAVVLEYECGKKVTSSK